MNPSPNIKIPHGASRKRRSPRFFTEGQMVTGTIIVIIIMIAILLTLLDQITVESNHPQTFATTQSLTGTRFHIRI